MGKKTEKKKGTDFCQISRNFCEILQTKYSGSDPVFRFYERRGAMEDDLESFLNSRGSKRGHKSIEETQGGYSNRLILDDNSFCVCFCSHGPNLPGCTLS